MALLKRIYINLQKSAVSEMAPLSKTLSEVISHLSKQYNEAFLHCSLIIFARY